MEEKISEALNGLEGDLKGTYYPLTGMTKETQQQLIDDHFLFKEGDRFLQAANACRYWPAGRGIYHNDDKTFLVWCNEEDHLRIISMQMGGDIGAVFRRLVNAANSIEKIVPFSHHDRLGFQTFCPTNLGTTIRASVHIGLPKLAADLKKLEAIAGNYDISNKRRMGLTEGEAVMEMQNGILELIKMEKAMEKASKIDQQVLDHVVDGFHDLESVTAGFAAALNGAQAGLTGSGGASSGSSGNKMDDPAILAKLEAGFKKLEGAKDCKSLLKKYLTRDVFDKLKHKKTKLGATLLDVIQSGVENLDSGVGLYAPDAESYSLFAPFFDPVIEDYHVGFKQTDSHPPKNFGDVNAFINVDPEGKYVVSTRIRCGRSLEGYPFNPSLTEAMYKEMEKKVSTALSGLTGELKGTFYPLTGMEKDVQQKLIDDHFLFKEGDRFLQAANACRYWPAGRGIYHNDNKTFLVWCNEEEHLRIISMQMGGDIGQVFRRLVTAANEIEKRLPFSHHDRLGFQTFCPTNLGTTIRASVHIGLPKLAADLKKLEAVAGKYNLQVRGTRGEHTEAEGGIYDISNKRRM